LTDLEARRMRFPDGAVRAGYNLQTAAVPDKGLIVAIKTDRQLDRRLFDVRRRAVLQDRLPAADLLQRQLAPFVVQLLEGQRYDRTDTECGHQKARDRIHAHDAQICRSSAAHC
jgi:hypothetical protein